MASLLGPWHHCDAPWHHCDAPWHHCGAPWHHCALLQKKKKKSGLASVSVSSLASRRDRLKTASASPPPSLSHSCCCARHTACTRSLHLSLSSANSRILSRSCTFRRHSLTWLRSWRNAVTRHVTGRPRRLRPGEKYMSIAFCADRLLAEPKDVTKQPHAGALQVLLDAG